MTTEVIEFSPSQSLGYDFVSPHFHDPINSQSKGNPIETTRLIQTYNHNISTYYQKSFTHRNPLYTISYHPIFTILSIHNQRKIVVYND